MSSAAQPRRTNWFGQWLLGGAGGLFRRSDAHPDAPPRPPLSAARDLAMPIHGGGRDVPTDLNQPLAAFDPDALLDIPLPVPERITPLARPALIDPGDRFETFELTPIFTRPPAPYAELESFAEPTPPVVPEPMPVIGPETAATVHDLLARLERGLKAQDEPPATIAESLDDLRRMARDGD